MSNLLNTMGFKRIESEIDVYTCIVNGNCLYVVINYNRDIDIPVIDGFNSDNSFITPNADIAVTELLDFVARSAVEEYIFKKHIFNNA